MNRAILDVLEQHVYPADDLLNRLCQTWTQINRATRVIVANKSIVTFPTGDVKWIEELVWIERAGVRGWCWRALGSLLSNDHVYQRGLATRVVEKPQYGSETVTLQSVGVWGGYELSAGYSGLADVLCLRWALSPDNPLSRLEVLTELFDCGFPVRQFETLFDARVESAVVSIEDDLIIMRLPDEPLASAVDGWFASGCVWDGDQYMVTWQRT